MSTTFEAAQEPTKNIKMMRPNHTEGDSAKAVAPSATATTTTAAVSLTPTPTLYTPATIQPGRSLSSLPVMMATHLAEWTTNVVNIINDVTLRDFVTIANPPVCTSIWTYGAGLFEETTYPLADYDFHVVITGRLSYSTQIALNDYNKKFIKEKGIDVDAYYILDSAARGITDPASLVTHESKMDDYPVDDAWSLHRAHVWAGRYATTYGADPQTFLAPVDYTQLQQSAMQLIGECLPRTPPSSNHGCGTPYGTLQMTRLIYSAVTKNFVVSKASAAQWALTQNDDMLPYRPQIAAALRAYHKTATDIDVLTIRRGIWPLAAYARSIMDSEWNSGWMKYNELVNAGMEWVNHTPAVSFNNDFVVNASSSSSSSPSSPVPTVTSSVSSPTTTLPPLTSLSTPSSSNTSVLSTESVVATAAAIATAAALASFTISTPSTPSSMTSLSPPASTSAPFTPDASPIPAL